MDLEILSYILRGEKRRKILELLEVPRTPKVLAEILDTSIPNVSVTLRAFEKMGLVKCVNRDAKKGRIYVLTEKGRKVLEEIKRILGSKT